MLILFCNRKNYYNKYYEVTLQKDSTQRNTTIRKEMKKDIK